MTRDAHRVVIEEAIRQHWKDRQWFRRTSWADWPDLRKENEIELRLLVRLARAARDLIAAEPDPMTAAKADFDLYSPEGYESSQEALASWSETEKAGAWGR